MRFPYALAALRRFWDDTLRVTDYPECEEDWTHLLRQPVPIRGPFDWGLAVGPDEPDPSGWCSRPTVAGLLGAFADARDPSAGDVLAMLFSRWLAFMGVDRHWDGIVAPPPSLLSGHPEVEARLLHRTDVEWPLPLHRQVWIRRAAHDSPVTSAYASDADGALRARRLDGDRILLFLAAHRHAEPAAALTTLLAQAGAAKVGLVALCARLPDPALAET